MKDNRKVSRRGFIETAGVATGAMVAAGAFPHPAVGGGVKGANEKINVAVLGSGGRAQEHLRILLKMKNKEQKPVDIIGLCDVWDGNKDVGRGSLLLGREVRARLAGQRQGPRHQGLSQDPRHARTSTSS